MTISSNIVILCIINPLDDIVTRNSELEYAKKGSIGNDIWIKGNIIILPGIKKRNGVIIENGGIITKNFKIIFMFLF